MFGFSVLIEKQAESDYPCLVADGTPVRRDFSIPTINRANAFVVGDRAGRAEALRGAGLAAFSSQS